MTETEDLALLQIFKKIKIGEVSYENDKLRQ